MAPTQTVTPKQLVAGTLGSLCLLALSVQGVDNTWRNRHDIETLAQWVMSLAQLGYALSGLVVVGLWWARSSALHLALLAWCVTFVAAVTCILPAWAPEDAALTPRFFMAACAMAATIGGCLWYFAPRVAASQRGRVSPSARAVPPD